MRIIFRRLMDMLRDRFRVDPLFMYILELTGITIDPELLEIDRILEDDEMILPNSTNINSCLPGEWETAPSLGVGLVNPCRKREGKAVSIEPNDATRRAGFVASLRPERLD